MIGKNLKLMMKSIFCCIIPHLTFKISRVIMDSLQEALENAFLKYANHTAIEVENHTLTYAKLQNKSLNLLSFLRAKNVGGGQIASLCLGIVS